MPTDTNPIHEAERAVLSAILNHSYAIEIAADLLRLEHFRDRRHRAIYEACCELQIQEIDIDLITVNDNLTRKGKQSAPYLTELLSVVSTSANIRQHAEVMIDDYIRRKVFGITRNMPSGETGHALFAEVLRRVAVLEGEVSTGTDMRQLFTIPAMDSILTRLTDKSVSDKQLFSTGIDVLDNVIGGLATGTVTALQGLYKSGKTKLLLMILVRAARQGTPVGLLSLEMSANRVRDWVLSHLCRIDSRFFKAPHATEWQGQRDDFAGYIKERLPELVGLPFYVNDIRRPTIEQVTAIVAKWARHGVKLVGLDYFDRMQIDGDWKDEGVVTSKMADLAMKYDVAFVYLDQLNKTQEQAGATTSLAHARGSVSRCADADCILQIKNISSRQRNEDTADHMSELEMLIVERDGVSGKRIRLMADLSTGRFAGKNGGNG